jgi:hypothetical protein
MAIRFADVNEKPAPKPKLSKLDVARAVLEAVSNKSAGGNAGGNAPDAVVVTPDRKADRHKGSRAEYMRQRRANERERKTAAKSPSDKA